MDNKKIADSFGNGVTKKRLAELAGMTDEEYAAMRDREPLVLDQDDEESCGR